MGAFRILRGRPIGPTLGNLTLSPNTATAASAYSGTISGATTGSTIGAASSDGTTLTVSGTGATRTLTGTFATPGTPTITLTESIANSPNSPHSSTPGFTVAAASSSTTTLRSTDTQLIDLTSALSSLPDSTRITLAVTGSVQAQVWPYAFAADLIGNGASRSHAKPFLINHLAAVTSSATTGNGVGTWTLTAPSFSYTHTFNVDNTAPTTWVFGQASLAQYGGYPIAEYLAGTATDWAITSQSTAGAFTINTTTLCVAFAGTAGSATRTVGTPAIGAAAYTVTLTNSVLSQSITISFTTVANRYDCAADDNTQLLNTVGLASHYGDEIWLNDTPAGTYQNPTRADALTYAYATARSQRAGGPALPAGPYASDSYAWSWGVQRHPGWITIRPRTPWGCRVNRLSFVPPSGTKAPYIRCYLMDNRNNASPSTGAIIYGDGQQWLMFDHTISSDIACTGNDSNSSTRGNLFAIENCVGVTVATAQSNGVAIMGTDSQIVGNLISGVSNDAIAWWLADSVVGSGKSLNAWNFVRNKKYPNTGAHGDFSQVYGSGANVALADVLAIVNADKTFTLAREVGNVFFRGQGQIGDGTVDQGGSGDLGKDIQDGQGSWAGDWNAYMGEYCAQMQVIGQVSISSYVGGIGRKWLGPGSTVRNCTVIWPQYPTNYATDLGMGSPEIRVMGVNAKWGISDNVISGLGSTGQGVNVENNEVLAPTPVMDNNYSINSTDASAVFVSPSTALSTAQYLEQVIDALTPKAGGPATVAGGATRVRGAVGTGLIDHLLRTVDASLLTTITGQPTSQAHWDATALPSGTGTVGSVLTAPNFNWNDTVTGISDVWLRDGVQLAATGTTYTLVSADSGHSVAYGKRVTDSQGNVVAAVSAGVVVA